MPSRDRNRFVHLHVHGEHSQQDGISRSDDLVNAAVRDGQPAVALTDHGSIAGTWRFGQAAAAAGIKPILGAEAYLSIGDRRLRGSRMVPRDLLGADGGSSDTDTGDSGVESTDVSGGFKRQTYEHLTVLAATPAGFGNLARLTADASQNVFTRPRMDLASLAEHADGLIALTGCVSGPVAGALLRDGTRNPDGTVFDGRAAAKRAIIDLRDIFGRDRLFIEVMDHGIPAERRVTQELFDFARRARLKAVFTNDSHYTEPADAALHDLWLCIGENSRQGAGKPPFKITDTNRWRFTGTGYHLRSTAEMWALAGGDDRAELALRNTLLVADMVDPCVLPQPRIRLPRYDRLRGHPTSTDLLWALVRDGAATRWGADWRATRPDVVARLDREMAVIDQMGFPDYFLIVWEALDAARRAGHRVGPGRGSAAGSAVSYTLRIVDVDPLANGLLFERFLDPTRAEMPDIDSDLDRAGQQWMFRYLADRWGAGQVARIGAPGFTRARSSIKDVARATLAGQSAITVGGQLAAKVPPVPGVSLAGLLDPRNPDGEALRAAVAGDPAHTELVDRAVGVENLVKQSGVHACGVVVSSEPLAPLTPLRQATADDGQPMWVTEWDVHDLSDLGLVKIDFLGLRTLDVISAAVRQIRDSVGVDVDPTGLNPDPDDPAAAATWSMIAGGRTAGVFQIESASMAGLCERARPSSVDDLSAILALWRPGPISAGFPELFAARKTGAEPVDYSIFTSDPDEEKILREVLDTTYGLIVYQEQIMQIGSAVAGFGPKLTSQLRRAVSKKDAAAMTDIGRLFLDGAQRPVNDDDQPKQVFGRSTAKALWAGIQGAGSYAFNKSHSRAYAELTWQTAWLKANYLPQYSAALLACTDTADKRAAALMDLRSEEVTVLGPSVNQGAVLTSCDRDGTVRLGLSEITGVGSAGAAIVRERLQGGPFTSLWDLRRRVRVPDGNGSGDTRQLSAAKLLALIEAGALDEFGPRMGLAATIHTVKAPAPVPPPDMEWPTLERSARERRVLGISLSANPLRAARETVNAWRTPDLTRRPVPVHRVPAVDGADTLVLGVLASADIRVFSGRERASIVVEGTHSQLPGVIWPNQLAQITRGRGMPPTGSAIAARGRVRLVEAHHPADEAQAAAIDDTGPAADKRKELTVFDLWQVELPDDSRPLPPTRSLWSVLTRQESADHSHVEPDDAATTQDPPDAPTQDPAPTHDHRSDRTAAVVEPAAGPGPASTPVPTKPTPATGVAMDPPATAGGFATGPRVVSRDATTPAAHPMDVLCVCAGDGLPIGDRRIGRLLTSVNLFCGLDDAAGPSSLHRKLATLPKWTRSRVLRSADGARRLVIVVIPDNWRPGLTQGVDARLFAVHIQDMRPTNTGGTPPQSSWSLAVADIPGGAVDTAAERALVQALTSPARAAGGAA